MAFLWVWTTFFGGGFGWRFGLMLLNPGGRDARQCPSQPGIVHPPRARGATCSYAKERFGRCTRKAASRRVLRFAQGDSSRGRDPVILVVSSNRFRTAANVHLSAGERG